MCSTFWSQPLVAPSQLIPKRLLTLEPLQLELQAIPLELDFELSATTVVAAASATAEVLIFKDGQTRDDFEAIACRAGKTTVLDGQVELQASTVVAQASAAAEVIVFQTRDTSGDGNGTTTSAHELHHLIDSLVSLSSDNLWGNE